MRHPHPLVLVHGGARDGYQVARALSEADLLERLVTDFAWLPHRTWMKWAEPLLPAPILSQLRRRSLNDVPALRVENHAGAALRSILLDRVRHLPFSWRQQSIRSADRILGLAAARRANRSGCGLLSYSYYAYDAFRAFRGSGILFQVHPHPSSVRRILREELAAHPDCRGSLEQEWELSLPPDDFQRLAAEPGLARRFLCASSFTRHTLVENGADAAGIRVVPYGVDLEQFAPPTSAPATSGPLQLLFVGRINQRKGIKYLLQALDLLRSQDVHLTVCGRVIDGLSLFQQYADRVTIRPSVSAEELRAAYQAADLFVFPSVAEGFAQVLLESLASGLPILSTTHTAAPDLITDGVEGFIVEPRRPDLLASKIEWALTHREDLLRMRSAARRAAERFTWDRFRAGIVSAVTDFASEVQAP